MMATSAAQSSTKAVSPGLIWLMPIPSRMYAACPMGPPRCEATPGLLGCKLVKAARPSRPSYRSLDSTIPGGRGAVNPRSGQTGRPARTVSVRRAVWHPGCVAWVRGSVAAQGPDVWSRPRGAEFDAESDAEFDAESGAAPDGHTGRPRTWPGRLVRSPQDQPLRVDVVAQDAQLLGVRRLGDGGARDV